MTVSSDAIKDMIKSRIDQLSQNKNTIANLAKQLKAFEADKARLEGDLTQLRADLKLIEPEPERKID